jgi:hypothetical protein
VVRGEVVAQREIVEKLGDELDDKLVAELGDIRNLALTRSILNKYIYNQLVIAFPAHHLANPPCATEYAPRASMPMPLG